ncbi:MAG: ADP-heptose--LPS heptosyltransferase II [Candidatus Kapaibacterium sp.]|nr:MAG: ADP-heptose--LPS heptosyltransferase II [Candidatus Kapabacteria bacterium]
MTLERARQVLARAHRIGIVRTDHLGDMVLTLPLARVLREEYPHAEIAVVAHSRTAPLIEGTPVVDRYCYVDQTPLGSLLEGMPCDAIFFPRARADEVWHAWKHRVPLRVGTAYRWWSFLYSVRIREHRSRALFHEAAYNVRMLESITGRQYAVALVPPVVRASAQAAVAQRLVAAGIGQSDRLIVLHPGGRGSAPRWQNFPALALLLDAMLEDPWRLVVTGTPAEAASCSAIANQVQRAVNLCGALSLAELIALLARASLVVANSTGVLHIAAALGTPVVGLFPAQPPALSPSRWGPLVNPAIVLAATPIERIQPAQVAEAICQLLRKLPHQ